MSMKLKKRAERFEQLGRQARETMAVTALHDLGIFEALRKGPRGAVELAAAVGAGPTKLRQFLDAACVGGFLEKEPGAVPAEAVYRLVSGDEVLFDPEGPHVRTLGLSGWSRTFAAFSRVREVLLKDEAFPSAGAGAAVSADERRGFLMYLHARSLKAAGEVARILAREEYRAVLDLGSGAGTYAFALLRESELAHATLVDHENAVPVILECARSMGVGMDRFEVRAVDFFTEDYGRGFDLAILSNVLHVYEPHRSKALLRALRGRMSPGGRVVVKELVVDEQRIGPETGVWFGVTMALFGQGGDAYSEKELVEWIEEAGFGHEITYGLREAPESQLIVARVPRDG
ncbi:MAG: methyltransferase domain-containing protein [Deltaproteobacteria bacterium]|nr:methyltransferase domain-containing protein [Deltaproteobacteria bacterium]